VGIDRRRSCLGRGPALLPQRHSGYQILWRPEVADLLKEAA